MESSKYAEFSEITREQLIDIILDLREQIKQIKNATPKDSTNSSIPSGKELVPHTRTLRKKSGKKSGGQKGHKGVGRKKNPNPDKIVVISPMVCSNCDMSLRDISGSVVQTSQMIDIPPLVAITTEYQQIQKVCTCCGVNTTLPLPYTGYGNLGDNITATIGYLNIMHAIPYERLCMILKDILHIPISEGSIENKLNVLDTKAYEIYIHIKETISKQDIVGSDETGTRVAGKRIWEWVWQSTHFCLYAIDPSRGYQVVKKYFGENFLGIFIHDCWSAQNNTKALLHQLCLAHLIRNLQYAIEAQNSHWSYTFQRFLIKAQKARDIIWEEGVPPPRRKQVIAQYVNLLEKFCTAPLKKSEEKMLQKRIKKHKNSILTFMSYPGMPATNNGSEQMIRMAKTKDKVSGGFRAYEGSQRYARILSVIQTCKKQQIPVFQALLDILNGSNPLNF